MDCYLEVQRYKKRKKYETFVHEFFSTARFSLSELLM
jgi:hypothetical protein